MSEKNICCPHCQTELLLNEEMLGQNVQCPVCNRNFTAGISPNENDQDSGEFEELNEEELVELDSAESAAKKKRLKLELDKLKAGEQNNSCADEDEDNLDVPNPGQVSSKQFELGSWMQVILVLLGIGLGITAIVFFIVAYNEHGKTSKIAFIFGAVSIILAIVFFVLSRGKKMEPFVNMRDIVKQYFEIEGSVNNIADFIGFIFSAVFQNLPLIGVFIKASNDAYTKKYCEMRAPYYDALQKIDMEYLNKLNVLHRFGKDKTQLVTEMVTLFAPSFNGVEKVMPYAARVETTDRIYRYNLEEVTKIYTFEDQLFLYIGIWDYSLGRMLKEYTEAFFFSEITDMTTSSNYKISKKEEHGGCLSVIIPGLKKTTRTVYKESESFTLTAASGHEISVRMGFEESIAASGATYTHRSNNERVIHAIRKMVEEKKALTNG